MPDKKPKIIEPTTASFVAKRQNKTAITGAKVAEFLMVHANMFHHAACSVRNIPKIIIKPVKINNERFVYLINCSGVADGRSPAPTSFTKLVSPYNLHGAPQRKAHSHIPKKNKPTSRAGNTFIKYCGKPTNPNDELGITTAAQRPNKTPSKTNGMPNTAASFNPCCPSLGVLHDKAI